MGDRGQTLLAAGQSWENLKRSCLRSSLCGLSVSRFLSPFSGVSSPFFFIYFLWDPPVPSVLFAFTSTAFRGVEGQILSTRSYCFYQSRVSAPLCAYLFVDNRVQFTVMDAIAWIT